MEWNPSSSSAPRRRAVSVGVVWLVTLALGLAVAVPTARDAPVVEIWVADRGRGELVGLSRRLTPVVTLSLEAPEQVASAGPDAVWVAAGERLLRVRADGAVSVDHPLAPVHDLLALPGGDVLVLQRSGLLLRYDSAGGSRRLVELAGARCFAAQGERVLVACDEGWLAQVDVGPRPAIVGLTRTNGAILAVAATSVRTGPDRGWWLLEASSASRREPGGESRRLTLLSPDGDSLWSRSVPAHAQGLTPSPAGVWLTDLAGAGLLEIGPDAARSASIELPPGLQQPRILLDLGEGILVGTHGALLALARDGTVVGSQGGFAELVDGARACVSR